MSSAWLLPPHLCHTCNADVKSNYHYHSEPAKGCVYTDTTSKHSSLYALMADGIPLFGAFGDNGAVPTDLDECRGEARAGVPAR